MVDKLWRLLDGFDRDQVVRMVSAHEAGDREGAERARGYLVAEGSVGRDEAELLDQVSQAALLIRDVVVALNAGDDGAAEQIRDRVVAEFPPAVVHTVLAALLLQAGTAQGWLPPAQHDAMTRVISRLGPHEQAAAGLVRRGQPE